MFAKIEQRTSNLKLFSQIATSAMYARELDKFENITYNLDDTILKQFSHNLSENIDKLKKYTKKYEGNYGDSEIIIQKAIDCGDIDLTLDAEYQQLKQFNDKFGFIRFMKCKNYDKQDFIKELNTQLLMRKKCSNMDFDMFEICVKEKKQEETILETEVA